MVLNYINNINRTFQSGISTEISYYPILKILIESMDTNIEAIIAPKRKTDCGAPDFAIRRNNQTIGYIEAKDIGKNLDNILDSDQIQRYLTSLENLLLTNYSEFRWYCNGKLRATVSISLNRQNPRENYQKIKDLIYNFLGYRPEAVTNETELARRMAKIALMIKEIIKQSFDIGSSSQMLKDLKDAFTKVLIPDLEIEQFADLFSQTLVYSLFSARCTLKNGKFDRDTAINNIPKENPFLNHLLKTIIAPNLDGEPYIEFIDDIIQLLDLTDVDRLFNCFNLVEDPIIYFYENFLVFYDPELKEKRGVFYTPLPLVSYIVKSVDQLLKHKLNLPKGLADESMLKTDSTPEENLVPKVLILDPACGTGTFLCKTIELIRDNFIRDNNAGLWKDYVKDHLIPRLFGFELLMAPYTIAHLKLGMQLLGKDLPERQVDKWSYSFHKERLNIYLTNTLEEGKTYPDIPFAKFISDEANFATEVKKNLPIMVVLGNPPYKAISANKSTWIENLLKGDIDGVSYYNVEGEPLGEKKLWIKNDYIKFIRFGQYRINQTGCGILAFVTGNGYLSRSTYRGVREKLFKTFNEIYIFNLHGNSISGEDLSKNEVDENVFDIQSGVTISIFVKELGKSGPANIFYTDLFGSRDFKYKVLANNDVFSTTWNEKEATPKFPYYYFTPVNHRFDEEFNKGWSIKDIFPQNNSGIVTSRDKFTIHYRKETLISTITDFTSLDIETARSKYRLGEDSDSWSVLSAQNDIKAHGTEDKYIQSILYRPFDKRYTYYTGKNGGFISRPIFNLMKQMTTNENLALLWTRPMEPTYEFTILCTDLIADQCVAGKKSKGAGTTYLAPLYIHNSENTGRILNISSDFIKALSNALNLSFISTEQGDLKLNFGAKDIFYFIYGFLWCPTYKERYKSPLKRHYPTIPIINNLALFKELVCVGKKLVKLHLLKYEPSSSENIRYPEDGPNIIGPGYPKYFGPGQKDPESNLPLKNGRVYISRGNARRNKKAQYFEGISPMVWDFEIGGYRVCYEWLYKRKNCDLSYDDRIYFINLAKTVIQTIKLMDDIDTILSSYWATCE